MADKKTITVQHLANVLKDALEMSNNGFGKNFYASQISAFTMLFGRPFVHKAVEIMREQS